MIQNKNSMKSYNVGQLGSNIMLARVEAYSGSATEPCSILDCFNNVIIDFLFEIMLRKYLIFSPCSLKRKS